MRMKRRMSAAAWQAKQALLDEQLRGDRLTGQRESLERTLRQAQEALSEQLPDSSSLWSPDDTASEVALTLTTVMAACIEVQGMSC
jgi:AraC-like DNA-binding protein